jgi:glycosyltransferase involved in cell wall biosynthesis
MSAALTFSIAIPVYNRETFIRRALASCLSQRHGSFEVIVVDDGSTDRTAEVVSGIVDRRVRLLTQPVNRGVSPARNLAVEHARGEWIVFLDSDDELTADALALMDAEVRTAPSDVQGFRFMCRMDNGALSPEPPLGREVWDYAAYVRWTGRVCVQTSEAVVRQETLMCMRRRSFDTVRFPDGRAVESLYLFDFAERFLMATSPAVVRRYHSDAPDQLTSPTLNQMLESASDHARSFKALLDRHGAALARWAPALGVQYARGLATQQFLAGDRTAGVKTVARLIRAGDGSLNTWAVLLFGLAGPRALALARTRRKSAAPLPTQGEPRPAPGVQPGVGHEPPHHHGELNQRHS